MERDSAEHTNKGWLRQIVGDLAVTLFLRGKIASQKLFKRRCRSGAKDSGTFADGVDLGAVLMLMVD